MCELSQVGKPRTGATPPLRVELMFRWLKENAGRVERPEKVQVTFDCAGGAVSVEVKERQRIGSGKT